MAKPIVAIVGRPNVGKSTLFNKLIGERRSIVEDTPGVTRDRIYGETEWCARKLVVIDTGGIEPKTDDIILKQMRFQAQIAIDTADVIIFMCDVRTGLTADDRDIATMLKITEHAVITFFPLSMFHCACINFTTPHITRARNKIKIYSNKYRKTT